MKGVMCAVAVTLLAAGPASALCFQPTFFERAPSAPMQPYLSKPRVPYCLSSYAYSGTHSCSKWEIDSYFDDVSDYVDDVKEYNDDVVRFANAAVAFANAASRYSDKVYDFALCDIKDVNTQHE